MLEEKSASTPGLLDLVETSRAARVLSLRLREDLGKLCGQVNSEVLRAQEIALSVNRRSRMIRETRSSIQGYFPGPDEMKQVLALPPAEMSSEDAALLGMLTPREREVLRLIGEGRRTKEIAFDLGISVKTAITHRSHIMDKIGIHSGPSLVRFAIRTGLCNP